MRNKQLRQGSKTYYFIQGPGFVLNMDAKEVNLALILARFLKSSGSFLRLHLVFICNMMDQIKFFISGCSFLLLGMLIVVNRNRELI